MDYNGTLSMFLTKEVVIILIQHGQSDSSRLDSLDKQKYGCQILLWNSLKHTPGRKFKAFLVITLCLILCKLENTLKYPHFEIKNLSTIASLMSKWSGLQNAILPPFL